MTKALIPTTHVQNLFDAFVNEAFSGSPRSTAGWRPAVDLTEDDLAFHLTVELPGFREDEISLELQDQLLTISANRELEIKDGLQHRLNERRHGRFERSFRLPNSVDPAEIKASLDLGVLDISLPKRAETRSRTISIRSSEA